MRLVLIRKDDPYKVIKLILLGCLLLTAYHFLTTSSSCKMLLEKADKYGTPREQMMINSVYGITLAFTFFGGAALTITPIVILIFKKLKSRKEEREWE